MTQLSNTLRQQLRQARQSLSPSQLRHASQHIAKALQSLPEFPHCQHIAAYLANDGELSCEPVLTRLPRRRRHCYLPVIHQDHRRFRMDFYPYQPGQTLRPNRFKILEPANRRQPPIITTKLDAVLVPLVGFDRQGNRLGMGGGYYDRSFAAKNRRQQRHKTPILIGIAHSIQEVPNLAPRHWDVPLDIILTEREIIRVRRNA